MSRRIRGVALVVANPDNEVLILQEFESKPYLGKYAGMFSIPMETSKPGEPDHSALARLVTEELPGFTTSLEISEARRGGYRIGPHGWGSLYAATVPNGTLPNPTSQTSEVGNHKWVLLPDAKRLWLRQGAREMLDDFATSQSDVVCRLCAATNPCPPALSKTKTG